MSRPRPLAQLLGSSAEHPSCASAAEMAEPLNAVLAHYRARKGDESPLATCMTMLEGKAPPCVCDALQAMTPEWRDYAIACVYALLMPGDERTHYGT